MIEKGNRIKVLRESGSPLLICSFVTPKVHHGVSHPSSGQSVACASASSHQYMRRVLSSGRFPRRVVTGRRVSFCCCYVASVVSDSVRPYRRQTTRLRSLWDSPGKNTGVGCHFLLQCMEVKSESEVAPLCPTPSDPMDCSLPGSSVHGIFQARVLEWGAIE